MDNSQTDITITKKLLETHLETWVEAFLLDRKVQNLSANTLEFYRARLALFATFCETQVITDVMQLTPGAIRLFLVWLEQTGHNPGGVHAAYRALKAFLRWLWAELEPAVKNPIEKVKAPKVADEPLEPVELEDVAALLKTCADDFQGLRDKAIFLFLLDTGARAREALSIDRDDVDLVTGAVMIRMGKGRKSRTVFLGQKSRKAIRRYIAARRDDCQALFVTDHGPRARMQYNGLHAMLTRRAELAHIEAPDLHDFRRAFALNMLRAGVDVYSLQTLMGHADLQILRRYLKQNDSDLKAAHAKGSPADRLT